MADYIKRELVKSQFDKDEVYCYDVIMGAIDLIPAADVRENVRGEWVGEYDGYADGNPVYDMWYCSHCGYRYEDDEPPKWNYCPNCGADMRGDVDGH